MKIDKIRSVAAFSLLMKLLDDNAFSGVDRISLEELEPYVVRTEKRQAIDYNGKPLFNKRRTEILTAEYDNKRHKLQQKLYEDVTEYVKKGFALATKTKNTSYGFVMILFQRMMSSSTQAILDAIEKRANRLADEKKQNTAHDRVAEQLVRDPHLIDKAQVFANIEQLLKYDYFQKILLHQVVNFLQLLLFGHFLLCY